jgi:DNA polymerase-3 subunit delta'
MSEDDLSADALPGAPHPRETRRLVGQDAAEAAFLEAYRSGRMPHACILSGPEGVGKATFAYRAARFVFEHPDPSSATVLAARNLDVDPDRPSARRVLAFSHPDLHVLRRRADGEKKNVPTEISVHAARDAVAFFGSTAGEGGWRVLIVDSADELNRNSSNALLKAIEEPPAKSLIFLVNHVPGRLLPTIRSRCRRLSFRPLARDEIVEALSAPGIAADPAAAARAAAVAEGSVRTALKRLDERTLNIIAIVTDLLEALPDLRRADIHQMAEAVAKRESEADFEAVMDTVEEWLGRQARSRAGEGSARLAPLAEVWEKIARATREADRFNLDRRALVLTLFADLAEAVRRSRAA